MSSYLTKSASNLKCAELMLTKGMPLAIASSHSAYYSVFQMMKYVLARFMNVSYEQQNILTKSKDSHESLLKSFTTQLKTKVDKASVITGILSLYQSIKKMRTRCDYGTEIFTLGQLLANVTNVKDLNLRMSNILKFTI